MKTLGRSALLVLVFAMLGLQSGRSQVGDMASLEASMEMMNTLNETEGPSTRPTPHPEPTKRDVGSSVMTASRTPGKEKADEIASDKEGIHFS